MNGNDNGEDPNEESPLDLFWAWANRNVLAQGAGAYAKSIFPENSILQGLGRAATSKYEIPLPAPKSLFPKARPSINFSALGLDFAYNRLERGTMNVAHRENLETFAKWEPMRTTMLQNRDMFGSPEEFNEALLNVARSSGAISAMVSEQMMETPTSILFPEDRSGMRAWASDNASRLLGIPPEFPIPPEILDQDTGLSIAEILIKYNNPPPDPNALGAPWLVGPWGLPAEPMELDPATLSALELAGLSPGGPPILTSEWLEQFFPSDASTTGLDTSLDDTAAAIRGLIDEQLNATAATSNLGVAAGNVGTPLDGLAVATLGAQAALTLLAGAAGGSGGSQGGGAQGGGEAPGGDAAWGGGDAPGGGGNLPVDREVVDLINPWEERARPTTRPTPRPRSGAGGAGVHAFAHGGEFIVPGSGLGDRPFLLGLTPGEHVSVTPRGQQPGGGDTYITVNISDVKMQSDTDLNALAYAVANKIQRASGY